MSASRENQAVVIEDLNVRRTEAVEEAEVLREQVKALRSIIQNDRAEYMRAYNTLKKAGYTDKGHPLWTPPDLERTARKMEEHRDTTKCLRQIVRGQGIDAEAGGGP